jgi:hypothetical protein
MKLEIWTNPQKYCTNSKTSNRFRLIKKTKSKKQNLKSHIRINFFFLKKKAIASMESNQFELENVGAVLSFRRAAYSGVLVAHEGIVVVSHGGGIEAVLAS